MGPRHTEVGTLTDLDVGFAQLFETGGQRAARIAGAEAGIARETAAADEARRLALRAVALAYLRTLYAQERIELLRGSETVAADVMTVADRRNAAGDIAVLDVNIAKIALARARAARLAAEGERTVFAGELQRLLGIPLGSTVVAAGSLRLQRRPDLAQPAGRGDRVVPTCAPWRPTSGTRRPTSASDARRHGPTSGWARA